MTTAARSQFLALLRANDETLDTLFQSIANKVRGLLLRRVDADGKVPLADWSRIEQQIASLILYLFLDRDGTGFVTASNGTLVAKSPYARLLWGATEEATRQAVAEQAELLRKALPTDLVTRLQAAQRNPFLSYDLIAADEGQALYRQYLPPYGDVFGDGKTLEDRLHAAAGSTRQQVAALVRQLLSEQPKASVIADRLTDYLSHNAQFVADRLLAGQTTYAYQKARLMSAVLNPLIEQVDVVLSPSHREVDDCDAAAAGSPYAVKDAPTLPIHGNCLCGYRFHVHDATQATAERISGSNLLNLQGALSPQFVDLLLRGGR